MDKLKTIVNIASKQTNLGCGLLALLTAGGEQIFSSAIFSCPCDEQNFVYGTVFLLVPALALLLLGYILNKRTWKLLTGLCYHMDKLCSCIRLRVIVTVFCQITCTALVAPCTWIAVALLSSKYYECLRTGTNVLMNNLCNKTKAQCENLNKFPCNGGMKGAGDVMIALKAESQILGWVLIASIMLSNLLLTCLARCTSPISYLQLKFWRAYTQEESRLIDSHMEKHAKELAERNIKSFFNQTEPAAITMPSNKDWEKVSTLYKFSTRKQYYSTLHRYAEEKANDEHDHRIRMGSIVSSETVGVNPAITHFVDEEGSAI